jgi:CubicO group peptidase (beta-lactamase class C family)
MKIAIVCLFLVSVLTFPALTASPTAKPEEVGVSSERLQRINQMVERHIAAGDIAGAVTIVARKGKVVHHSAQGVMDLQSKQPMSSASMFRIASMTKPVIGVAIMMLVEEGKLHLNDPVSRYIPQFRDMKVAVPRPAPGGAGGRAGGEGNTGPRFYTVPAERAITIKDLLTHVSGLGSGPMGNSDIEKVARKDGETLADYIPRLGSTALEFQPGSRWTYSPAPASRRSAASSRSHRALDSISSSAHASSIRSA